MIFFLNSDEQNLCLNMYAIQLLFPQDIALFKDLGRLETHLD